MMNRKAIYWLCNIGGWFLYVLLYALLNLNKGLNEDKKIWLWFVIFFFGLFFSHFYRYLIVRLQWLPMHISQVIPRLILSCLSFAVVLAFITVSTQMGLYLMNAAPGTEASAIPLNQVYLSTILGYLLIFVLWTVIYFAVHYFLNYKSAEIENLKWQASITEIELNKLKSQLNPHFVFNCMNSIRALVDEEPAKAKEAVTQLANILRNTLMMGRNRLVPFGEEMKVVKDYLALESIRLEERLIVTMQIAPDSNTFEVPPLMLQTLVENGIKHGIATLTGGGKLDIRSQVEVEGLLIEVRNSGQYKGNTDSETGFGIVNTLQRLALLYEGRARFDIANENNTTVITQLFIPKS
jgi:two-component system LytT family sensor kinase